jgi:ribosome-binding factor A
MPREFSRTLRVNVQIQRILPGLIRDGLTDPRIGSVTVTKVSVSPDLRNARISVSSLDDDEKLRISVKALNHASGVLRHGLADALKLRTVPALSFVADTILREGDRISALIRSATAGDRLKQLAAQAPTDSAPPAADPADDDKKTP